MPNRPSSVSTAGSGATVAALGSAACDGAVGSDVKRTMAASNARNNDLDCIRTPAVMCFVPHPSRATAAMARAARRPARHQKEASAHDPRRLEGDEHTATYVVNAPGAFRFHTKPLQTCYIRAHLTRGYHAAHYER